MSNECPLEKMEIEKAVYEYLIQNHQGIDNLIKNKDLRKIFNISGDKSMRRIIQNIREDKTYKKMVGSISGISGGFFIVTNDNEWDLTINNTKHRANQMHRLVHIMNWKRGLESENN